jgi:hypothetical protein
MPAQLLADVLRILTFTEIGKRLGMSRQAAHSLLFRSDKAVELPGIICCECRKEICSWNPRWHGGMRRGQLVYCLQCLGKHREVRLGERLLAFRISAGMTRGEWGFWHAGNSGERFYRAPWVRTFPAEHCVRMTNDQ